MQATCRTGLRGAEMKQTATWPRLSGACHSRFADPGPSLRLKETHGLTDRTPRFAGDLPLPDAY